MAIWLWEGILVAAALTFLKRAILWLLPTGLMLIQGQVLAESTMEQQQTVIFWRGQSLKSNPPRGGLSIQQGSLLLHGITWATTTDTTTWSVSASISLSFVVSCSFTNQKLLPFVCSETVTRPLWLQTAAAPMCCLSTRTSAGQLVMPPEEGMALVAMLLGQVSTLVLADISTSQGQDLRV